MLWNFNRFSGVMDLNAPNDSGTASARLGSTALARVVSRIIDYLNDGKPNVHDAVLLGVFVAASGVRLG